MKRSIEFECGGTTCASEPGKFCRFLDMGRWGAHPHCTAFNHPLFTDGDGLSGWLQRCEPCMELENMGDYITAKGTSVR